MANQLLRSLFLREARVIDSACSYISAPSFNLRMNPQVLQEAAREIVAAFADEKISAIHGIPHSGVYLATAVSIAWYQQTGRAIPLHAARKDQSVPATWKELYRQEIRSYTVNKAGLDVFTTINLSFVRAGDRILLVDDVCATGETAWNVISGLQKRGVKVVGFGVSFDKQFQGGLKRMADLGIKTFSCVRVKEIGRGDRVVVE